MLVMWLIKQDILFLLCWGRVTSNQSLDNIVSSLLLGSKSSHELPQSWMLHVETSRHYFRWTLEDILQSITFGAEGANPPVSNHTSKRFVSMRNMFCQKQLHFRNAHVKSYSQSKLKNREVRKILKTGTAEN